MASTFAGCLVERGDQNTHFFHRKASQRHQRNMIKKLRNQDGAWVTNLTEIEGLLSSHFQDIFTAGSLSDMEEICQALHLRLTDDHHEDLLVPFTAQDVYEALLVCILRRHLVPTV